MSIRQMLCQGVSVPVFDLNIQTTILLLVIGNFISALLVVSYKVPGRNLYLYLFSRFFQFLGWIFLWRHDEYPLWFNYLASNSLLHLGFAGECLAILTIDGRNRRLERLYGVIAAVAIAGVTVNYVTEASLNHMNFWASLMVFVTFAPAAWRLMVKDGLSRFARTLGGFYVAFCLSQAARAIYVLASTEEVSVLVPNVIHSFVFATAFALMIFGTVGYVLLHMERVEFHRQALERAKSEFLANMSHELRTPLNAIIGLARLLEQAKLPARERGYAARMTQAGSNLLAIINQILDFSKIEAGHLELEIAEYSPQEIARDVGAMVASTIDESRVKVILSFDENVPSLVRGDPLRTSQILFNLAANAAKFTESGEIALGLRLIETQRDGEVLRFSVSDTGIGIPANRRDRLFKAFSQVDASTSRKFGGTGLGLAISSQLVALMGGAIGCDSEVGKGSEFWFTVPCRTVAAPAPAPARREAPTASSIAGRLTGLEILVVEDNEVNQLVASELLTKAGAVVTLADCGQAAIDKLTEQPFTYDVVLMDIQMPGMDGFEAVRIIREDLKLETLPIIAITAHARDEDREKSRLAGMQAHVTKPFSVEEMFGAILACAPAKGPRGLAAPAPKAVETGRAAPSRLPGIDMEDVEHRLGGNVGLLALLLPQFAESFAVSRKALSLAIASGDWSLVETHFHKIRGSAGNVGAKRLAALAEVGENHAVEKKASSIVALLPLLDKEMALVRSGLAFSQHAHLD